MTIEIRETKIHGVIEILPDIFQDHRGNYVETYNKNEYAKIQNIEFVQDDISTSSKNVLRGLHGDTKTWKLVSSLHGEIYLVVLDVRPESETKNIWQSFIISDKNYRQILIPPGCANGHLVLSEKAIFHYKQSTYFAKDQFTIKWNDPQYGLWWPTKTPILSRRDELGKYIE